MKKILFDLTAAASGDGYKLLTGLTVPRPIGWIGTVRDDGTYNLAPFSFFNLISSTPPVVMFAAGSHADRPKDTSTLAAVRGEFTVNLVSAELAEAMNVTSGSFGADDDEFAIAGLTALPGLHVSAPLVAESPANYECRVRQVIGIGPGERTRMVLGDVVAIHVREDALDGTRVRPEVLDVIGRMSGSTYAYTRDRFDLRRPSEADG